jgi:23S rRNA (uracil1939-C5)-methyltransferase
VRAFPALAKVAAAFLEHPKSAPTLHVTWTMAGLDVDVTGVERKSGGLSRDRQMQAIRAANEADLARLSMAGRDPRHGPSAAHHVRPGQRASAARRLPAGRARGRARHDLARRRGREGLKEDRRPVLRLGQLHLPLATVAPVLAADASAAGIAALKAGVSSTSGLRQITAEARDLFRRPLSPFDLKGCDAIVFDPPRAGAIDQTQQIAGTKASVVVGVSCNPATFARDARVLIDAGFRLETVTPVDQFLWSAHVELVGVFRR